jgi:hypothetical protein
LISQSRGLGDVYKRQGQGDGSYEFMPGVERVSEEEYAEQVERMKNGQIPNLNDLGAVQAAKDTIAMYGSDD